MTSPVAAIGLTYDGTDLQESDLSILLQITQGLNEAPEVRGRDVLVPGRDGQIARPRRPHELRITLAGQVMGIGDDTDESRAAYRALVFLLRDLFNPARTPADLVATLEDGSTATISARPLNTMWNEVVVSEFANISVELVSVDPDWVFEEAP